MKKIIIISCWVILLTGTIVILGFIETDYKNIACRDIEIRIDQKQDGKLIDESEIAELITDTYDSVTGKAMQDIDQKYIEEIISRNPYIEEVHVYSTIDGILKIHAEQRQAIIRVFNTKYQSYYIDKSGYILPENRDYPVRLPVANGCIFESFRKPGQKTPNVNVMEDSVYMYPALHQLYQLALYIHNDSFLSAMIHQVYLTNRNEFELIPKVGRQVIIFGDLNDMEAKFNNLISFYKKGMSVSGWDKYDKINLKYKNQVICSKT